MGVLSHSCGTDGLLHAPTGLLLSFGQISFYEKTRINKKLPNGNKNI
jgi:hypothetical protein